MMSGRPRTTSFAEGNKQPLNPPLGGMKISSKFTSQFNVGFIIFIVLLSSFSRYLNLRSQHGCDDYVI